MRIKVSKHLKIIPFWYIFTLSWFMRSRVSAQPQAFCCFRFWHKERRYLVFSILFSPNNLCIPVLPRLPLSLYELLSVFFFFVRCLSSLENISLAREISPRVCSVVRENVRSSCSCDCRARHAVDTKAERLWDYIITEFKAIGEGT